MLIIDGSYGEGGGQILRTSVALACITGQDIKVINIRAKRKNPGLRNQHITALKVAAHLCKAEVTGLHLGSREVVFRPGGISSGTFNFDVGTAGSVTLILQTALPIMAHSQAPVKLVLKGGTDVPWSPTIDYFREVLAPHLRKMGLSAEIKLLRRGHYPKGGGVVEAYVPYPHGTLNSLRVVKRGRVTSVRGISHAVNLPKHVAIRQMESATRSLRNFGYNAPVEVMVEHRIDGAAPGSGITLWAEAGEALLGSDALGKKGKRAEDVGYEAGRKLAEDLNTGMALDRYMSDNIVIYLALAEGESVVGGSKLTAHARTVVWVIKQFLKTEIEVIGEAGKPFKLRVKGVPQSP